MKSIDLVKLSFNNPLLSFILDLDRIDPIVNDLLSESLLEEANQYENVRNWKVLTIEFIKWIEILLNGQEPQNLQSQQEECEYIKVMYRSLKEVWDRGRYQNKLKDDCSILEDTHTHP